MAGKRRTPERRRLLRSAPFVPNRGLQIEYAKILRGMVRGMVREVRGKIVTLYRRYASQIAVDSSQGAVAMDALTDDLQSMLDDFYARFPGRFENQGRAAAEKMVGQQFDNATRTFPDRMKDLLPVGAALALLASSEVKTESVAAAEKTITGFAPPPNSAEIAASVPAGQFSPGLAAGFVNGQITPQMREVLQAAVIENTTLIKTIPAKYLDRVAGAATRAIQAGASPKQLAETIARYGEMSINHATRIALDQTFKTYTSINVRKFQNAGIRQFEWLHTGGSIHPREFHLADYPEGLNHGIFDLDDPPEIDPRTGERGYPGQLPFCRCTMAAVVDLDMYG